MTSRSRPGRSIRPRSNNHANQGKPKPTAEGGGATCAFRGAMSKKKGKKKSVKTAKNAAATETRSRKPFSPNRFYPEEFKREAVKAVEEGRTPQEVAKIFGPHPSTIHAWLRKYTTKWKKGPRKRWQRVPKERKIAMVQQVLQGRSVPVVAEENDVSDAALYKWVKKYHPDPDALARKVNLGEALARKEKLDEERGRQKAERIAAAEEEKVSAKAMVADPLVWIIDLCRDFNIIVGAPLKILA